MHSTPRPGRALVLEGGAMRGIFTAGVLDALQARGELPFDYVVGVSAGACCAASFLARQQERNYVVFLDLMTGREFINPIRALRGGSLVDMSYLMGPVVREHYPLDIDALRAASSRFEVVATDATEAKACYLPGQGDDCIDALHTTISVPIFYGGSPASFRGAAYFDGALSDPVPIGRVLELGATDITVVLTRPRSWSPKPVGRLARAVLARKLADYPAVLSAIEAYDRTQQRARSFLTSGIEGVRLRVLMPPENFPVMRFTKDRKILHEGYAMGKRAVSDAGV